MATQSRLEIIKPDGSIEFVDLDNAKGFTNIGQSTENDIVLDSPDIAPFHLMIDHRRHPYRLVLLGAEGETLIDGVIVQPNVPLDLKHLNTIEFAGFTIVVLDHEFASAASVVGLEQEDQTLAVIAPEIPAEIPGVREELPPIPHLVQRLQSLPIDERDDDILTELPESEWAVEVEQSAYIQMTLVNGSQIVSRFHVSIEGIDPNWVTVTPEDINLNEGQRTTVTIAITPTRAPTSLAGNHFIAIVVTSPNHPGLRSVRGGILTINPYYEFVVGELSPKKQTVSYRHSIGHTIVQITNKGNSRSIFELESEDEIKGCRFEFIIREDGTGLFRHAEVEIDSGETVQIPVNIEPLRKRLFGFRSKQYPFTVTTKIREQDQIPRIVLGQFLTRPLFGPFSMILLFVALAVMFVNITRPKIARGSLVGKPAVVAAGSESTLTWDSSMFTRNLQLVGGDESIDVSGMDEVNVSPNEDAVTYTLVGENFISRLLPFVGNAQENVTILRIPDLPIIHNLSVDRNSIMRGEEILISWSASEANQLILRVGDQYEELSSEEFTGERIIILSEDTLIRLEASNSSGVELSSEFVKVAIPFLELEEFTVIPEEITEGDSVSISWIVHGTDQVEITPLESLAGNVTFFPAMGSVTFFPDQTMEFVLTAINTELEVREIRQVVVNPLVEPELPTINFFTATPSEVVGSGQVVLAWSFSEPFTKVEITSPSLAEPIKITERQGFMTVNVDAATVFVLTVCNWDQIAIAEVEVTVTDPDQEQTSTAIGIVDPSPAEKGESVTVNVSVTSLGTSGRTPTGSVVVSTDTGDSCTVTLPATSCTLVNTTAGAKTITATYSGDTYFITSTSATSSLTVTDSTPPQVASISHDAAAGTITVRFDEHVNNPSGDGTANDVTNPASYLLVDDGANGSFDSTGCAGGVIADDNAITINSITYSSSTFTATLSATMPTDNYRLIVCGLGASFIEDPSGNDLNGGTDHTPYDFSIP